MTSDMKITRIRETDLEILTLLIPFAGSFIVVLCGLCIAVIVSLATTGAIFGFALAGSIPWWVTVLIWMVDCLL